MLKGLYRKRVWLSGVLILLICLVLGKDCISARILGAYLSRTLQKQGWSFLQTQVKKDHILMQGISGPGVCIGQLDIFCHLSLIPFIFQPEITLSEVLLSLEEKSESKEKDFNFLGLALGNSFFDPKLRIEKGEIISSLSDSIFSFQFHPGLEDHKLGSLYVEEKGEEKAFLIAELSKQTKGLTVKAEIFEGKVFFLLPWISSLTEKLGSEKWDKLQGKVNAYIQCSFHQEKGLESLQANVGLEEVDLQSTSSGCTIQTKSLQGTLSFAANDSLPIWKQMDLFLTFEDLLWMTKQKEEGFGFTNALGEIRLQPREDPYVKIGGALKTKGTLMPFELEGSYELLDKGAYFLQTNLSFFLPHSQPEIIASFWQNEEGNKGLEAHWKQVGKEVSDVCQEIGSFFNAPECLLEKGEMEGKILAKGVLGEWKSVELSDFIAKNLVFSIPSKSISFAAQSASAQGLFDLEKVVSLQAEVRKGKVVLSDLQVDEIIAKVEIAEGEFMSSYIEGSYQGMKMAGQVLSSSAEALLHIECGLYPEDLQRWFPLNHKLTASQKDPIFVVLDVSPDGQEGRFAGTIRFPSTSDQPQDMDIKGVIHKTLSRSVSDIFSPWDLSSAEGTFSLDQLSAKTLFPYQKELFTSLQLQGSCNVTGSFNPKKINIDLSSLDISLTQGSYRLIGQIGNKEPVSLIYNKETNSLEGRAFVDSLFVEDKSSALSLEIQDTFFLGQDHYIWTDEWKAVIQGIEVLGSLTYDGDLIQIESKPYQGDVKSLQPFFKKYIPNIDLTSLEGTVFLSDKAYTAKAQKKEEGWDLTWILTAKFSDLASSLGTFGCLKEGQVVISTGSFGGFSLGEAKGRYEVASFSSDLSLKDFSWNPHEKADFCLTAKDSGKQALMLAGSILPEIEGFSFHISPRSHVLGLELEIDPILMRKNELPSLLKGSFSYKWESLPSYVTFFQQMGLLLPEYKLPLVEGNAKLQVIYDVKASKMHLHIDSPEVIYEKHPIGKMQCDLYHKEGFWALDSCEVGPYSFAGKMKKKESKWILEGLSFKSLETKILTDGTFDVVSQELILPNIFFSSETLGSQIESKGSFKGSFSAARVLEGRGVLDKFIFKKDLYVFTAKKGMSFVGSSQDGITLEKSQWECVDFTQKQSLAKISIQNLTYLFDEQKLLLGGGVIKIAKEGSTLLQDKTSYKEFIFLGSDKEITVKIDAEIAPDYKKMTGNIENGFLDFSGLVIDVKNVQLLQEKEKLYLSCQSLLQKKPIWIGWQSKIDQNILGALTFKEDIKDPGLSLQMEKKKDKPWTILSAEGSFQGLDLKMQKVDSLEKKNFAYNTQMKVDFAKLSLLFPAKSKEALQKLALGDGYGFIGVISIDPRSFHLVSCLGKVEAEEFTCLGRKMHSLKAKVSFAKDVFSLQDLCLEDNLGLLTIKTIEAKLQPETGHFLVTAPLIHIKDFSPSSFIKGGEPGAVIKNISLYQVKGFLQDINSFEATGALNFVKSIKKEFSFWDIPLNLMKDFGLDTGLLSPVVGEADFILSQGRLYFTSLKNMYSEGERSQFDLASPSAESYLGLDGSWHVDLKMKQNVVLKVTEDLVLSIRGTVEKPKYSFKWRGKDS